MQRVLRLIMAFFALFVASLTTYIVGVIINTQFVLAPYDVTITFAERFNMTMFDVSNMWLYFPVIAIALMIGFSIAALLKRFLPKLSAVAYPIAGAAAIGVTLGLMYVLAQTIPISGARSVAGYLGQILAGALGGYVFSRIVVRKMVA